jgi:predicted AAA+ superfamily ATPase
MIERPAYLKMLAAAVRRSPVTALMGPRQCGKTTLARLFQQGKNASHFDLESQADLQRLQNPEMMLGALKGLVVLDEIQVLPALFNVLRVLADRPRNPARFLILGSASPDIVKRTSESLAGRVEFVELGGFDLLETGADTWKDLWRRGGFPRSYLARSDPDSAAWREGFLKTFLERDIPQLGIPIPAAAMRRFWTMLSHYHGQTWNASELARSMGLSDKTVRSYLDILTGTYMVRQLQPWHENVGKRQVRAPKIYLRDSGILHALMNLGDDLALQAHPRVGASWEGFALEMVLRTLRPAEAYFWGTHSGAELDLLLTHRGRRFGFEFKYSEAPRVTRSAHTAISDLQLDHAWVVHPGEHLFPIEKKITAMPLTQISELPSAIARRAGR